MPRFSQVQLVGLMEDLVKGLNADLGEMIRGKCNYPLALTLAVLTETLGGFRRGTFGQGESRKNYEEGLRALGLEYGAVLGAVTDSDGRDQLYEVLRCVSVHTYIFSKAIAGHLWIVKIMNTPERGVSPVSPYGIRVENGTIEVVTNTYASAVVDAFRRLEADARRGNTHALLQMERAILSQQR